MQRICSVLVAVFLLFPCVSASDDILGLSLLQSRHGGKSPSSPDKNRAHLERVLQQLENLQLSAAFILAIALSCIGVVEIGAFRSTARHLPRLIGRGPPIFA